MHRKTECPLQWSHWWKISTIYDYLQPTLKSKPWGCKCILFFFFFYPIHAFTCIEEEAHGAHRSPEKPWPIYIDFSTKYHFMHFNPFLIHSTPGGHDFNKLTFILSESLHVKFSLFGSVVPKKKMLKYLFLYKNL
jgi:hypothetical protein